MLTEPRCTFLGVCECVELCLAQGKTSVGYFLKRVYVTVNILELKRKIWIRHCTHVLVFTQNLGMRVWLRPLLPGPL